MPQLSELFEQSQGAPIVYNNKTLHRALLVSGHKKVKIITTFVAKSSKYKQGISFNMFSMKGKLSCNGETINKGSLVCCEDTSPKKFDVAAEINEGELSIFNVAEYIDFRGVSSTISLSMGMALYYEEIGPNKFRCYCNDWKPDDDFEDLIFDMEFVEY